MSSRQYRPEIDGLRAIAVLAVLLFHLQLKLPGGYVGVDIFFVISGYLITGLINTEINAGTFALKNFWERRVRRIMPAAAVMVGVSLIAGYFILLPTHFEEMGRSAVAQAVAAANVFFYRESGYFSTAAESKPLLHCWSLAVEEQFYLIFPLMLLALRRRSGNFIFAVVAAIAVASFGLSVVGTGHFPEATFYLLPARAWELALGGLLALRGCVLPLPEVSRAGLGWLGLGLMVAPMFLYDSATPFPGLAAFPPCLGAALVIWSTHLGNSALKRFLSLKPVVAVGLISYSLYLWHWPILVFSHYWYVGFYFPIGLRIFVAGLSFVLAWLSWRYVEIPFRSKRRIIPTRAVVFGALASIGITIFAGFFIFTKKGLPGRYSPAVVQYDSAYADRPEIKEADLTMEAVEAGRMTELWRPSGAKDSPSLLLWGDSHARVASTGVTAMCEEMKVTGMRASRSATACILGFGDNEAQQYNAAIFRWIEKQRPTWVVLASRWEVMLWDAKAEELLRATVAKIQSLGVKVAIMRQVTSQRRDIPKMLAHAVIWNENVDAIGVLVDQNASYLRVSNEALTRIARASPGLRMLDPVPYLSKNGRSLVQESGHSLYYDNQHLTRYGSRFLIPMFATLFDAAPASVTALQNAGKPSF